MRGIGAVIAGALLHNRGTAKGYRTIYRLNRSRRHPAAKSYEHAREIAVRRGKSNQPVR